MNGHCIGHFSWRFVVVGVACVVLQSQAQIYVLSHNNSVAQINAGSQSGMFNWNVDGYNQLYQQWFWYREGNLGPEQSIDTISAPTVTQPDSRTLYTSYANAQYGVEVDYMLTGFTPGSGISDITETITIWNFTASPLDFHFFQYSDFDLTGLIAGDVVQLGKNIHGLFNEAFQQNGNLTLTETVTTPGANHGEAAFFNATLVKLNDALPSTLNDNAGLVGPGNVTWALQWDLTVPAGSSVGISKDKYLHVVPEPSAAALVSVGLLACAIYRRKPSE